MAIQPVLDFVDGPAPLLAMPGILKEPEKRAWYLEPNAALLLITYGLGLYVLDCVGY